MSFRRVVNSDMRGLVTAGTSCSAAAERWSKHRAWFPAVGAAHRRFAGRCRALPSPPAGVERRSDDHQPVSSTASDQHQPASSRETPTCGAGDEIRRAAGATLLPILAWLPDQREAPPASVPGAPLVERVTRIELALSAWEADVLPLNYTRAPAPGGPGHHTKPADGEVTAIERW